MTRKWRTPATWALVLAAGLLAVLASRDLGPRQYLARRWRRDLPTLPDEQVLPRLSQIAGLGDAGLPVLVEALESERERVASSSSAVLEEQLARWRPLVPEDSSPKVARLARLLASGAEDFSLVGRAAAARLATRILLWPIDRRAIDGGRLVADCEAVLRASPPAALHAALDSTASVRWGAAGVRERVVGGRSADARPKLPDLVGSSDSGLPSRDDPTGIRRAPGPPFVSPSPPSGTASPSGAPAGLSQRQPVEAPGLFSPPPPDSLAPVVSPPRGQRAASQEADSVRRGWYEVGGPPWRLLSDLEVIQRLNDDDPLTAGAALHVLEQRGYSALELGLAMRLIAPDPAERRGLADSVLRLSGVDARPWLIWLSLDEDLNVRRAAAAIMATSRDPELHKRLRAMARQDADADLRAQLEKLPALWR